MVLYIVLYLVLAAVFTEALTELIVKSVIFERPRDFLSSLGNFLGKLLSCGYCFSFQSAIIPATLSLFIYGSKGIIFSVVQWVVVWLVVQRLSNYIHNINDKFFDKYYSNKK